MQQYFCVFSFLRTGFYGDPQFSAELSAQIQSDPCGLPVMSAVGSGKSLVKNAPDLTVLNADTVI